MYPSIQVNKKGERLEIIVIPYFKPIMRIVFWLQTITLLVGAITFLPPLIITFEWDMIVRTSGAMLVGYLIMAVGLVVYFLAFLTFFKRILGRELITVSQEQLEIKNNYRLFSKSQRYEKSLIDNLRYMGRENFTSHPLKSESFDYLGFSTQEMENQILIEGGRIGFEYFGQEVRFGKDVEEEDAEEIVSKIHEFWQGEV